MNDLVEDLPEAASPDAFRDHAAAFVKQIVSDLRHDPESQLLRRVFRDEQLRSYVLQRVNDIDLKNDQRPILLVDEVEQAYMTLREAVRADDRSPLRAWLEACGKRNAVPLTRSQSPAPGNDVRRCGKRGFMPSRRVTLIPF